MVKNLNFIVTEFINGHLLLSIRLQEILSVGKWSKEKKSTEIKKKLMLSKMCDKYSQRPPSQEFVTLFFWEKKYSLVETPLPPCWQMSLNTQVF